MGSVALLCVFTYLVVVRFAVEYVGWWGVCLECRLYRLWFFGFAVFVVYSGYGFACRVYDGI